MVLDVLKKYARYDVPQSVCAWISETADRFGKLRLVPGPVMEGEEYLYLVSSDPYVFKEIDSNAFAKKILTSCVYKKPFEDAAELREEEKKYCFILKLTDRGTIKQNLLTLGWPVKDDVPLIDGEPCQIDLRETTLSGKKLEIRNYQKEAAEILVGDKKPGTGFVLQS